MNKDRNKKIILSGGGTGGSATPLINLFEALDKRADFEFLFVGSRAGVERKMAEKKSLRYVSIFSGKFRRYFSWKNFIDPIFIFIGFWQSIFIVLKERPDLIISAGSFISVPLVWAGWFFKVPVLLIQLDIRPGLANKVMAPAAETIAVTFERSLVNYGKKAAWTGAPFKTADCRLQISKKDIYHKYKFDNKLPLVLVVGGGTGALAINNIIKGSIDSLVNICNVLHLSGLGKKVSIEEKNYQQLEFLNYDKLVDVMKKVDLVVSRAGIGSISDLANLKKPAIIIPMPNSHQEDNARVLSDAGAAIVLEEGAITPDNFIHNIRNIFSEDSLRKDLSEKIGVFMKRKGTENIIDMINKMLKNENKNKQ